MTEKPYAPTKKERKITQKVKTPKQKIVEPIQKTEETKKPEIKKEDKKKTSPKVKKTFAVVNATNLPISTKKSMAVCKFIKGKKIGDAIRDLEQVVLIKKAVPMRGEIPHRKGKIMSGGFPKKTAEHFIKLLKSLSANSIVNELDEPFIAEAVVNIGARPSGRFGTIKRKRTHVKLVAKERKTNSNKKKGEKK
ncbi:MAG: hypothetical protein KJ566_02795 [Nanoarchaeota archaeon]|nr:hypothetical protein [Nanoarchaeota archaeon]